MQDVEKFLALMEELGRALPPDPRPEVRSAMANLIEAVVEGEGQADDMPLRAVGQGRGG